MKLKNSQIIVIFWLIIILVSGIAIAQTSLIRFNDFEEQKIGVDDWAYTGLDNPGEIQITNGSNVINGEYSLQITEGDSGGYGVVYSKNSSDLSASRFGVRFRSSKGFPNDNAHISGPNGQITRIRWHYDDDIVYITHNGGTSEFNTAVYANQTVTVEIHDIDYDANTFNVTWNDTSTGSPEVEAGPFTFQNDNPGINQFTLSTSFGGTQSIEADDIQFGGELYDSQPPPGDVSVDSPGYLKNGESKTYEVLLTNSSGTIDVTDDTTVVSTNTSLITIDSSNNALVGNDNNNTGAVTISYTYEDFNPVNVTVVVGDRNIASIGDLPPSQYIPAVLGIDEKGLIGGVGSEFQWILFSIIIMTAVTVMTRNAYVGIGFEVILIFLLWILEYVGVEILITVILFGLFIGFVAYDSETASIEFNNYR